MEEDILFQHVLFPKQKAKPLSLRFNPEMSDQSDTFINNYLGYPQCPLIGRYNKGQYKIADILSHMSIQCLYDEIQKKYKCGKKFVHLPEHLLYNLRNIPQFITNNKPQNQKKNDKIPEYNPYAFLARKKLTITWIISQGELGKDFLNYLNHMYILANTLFLDQKLRRTTYYLPICAHLPNGSGIRTEEVERGISYNQIRSQYMSIHLKYGAPAFSPNNMRIGLQGMKLVQSNQIKKNKQPKKQKQKYRQKYPEQIVKEKQKIEQMSNQQDFQLNWQQLEQQIKNQKVQTDSKIQNKNVKQFSTNQKKQNFQQPMDNLKHIHQGYIHFYTLVFLQEDYRVYYHWHLGQNIRRQVIYSLLDQSKTIQQIYNGYANFIGKDSLYLELGNLFGLL